MGDIYTNPPQSRNEAILRATIDGTEYTAPPQSRIEDLLLELKEAIEQGGAGEGDMEKSVYDADNAVATAGGIAAYVDDEITDLHLGTASTKNSTSVVTQSTDLVESGAVYDALTEVSSDIDDIKAYIGYEGTPIVGVQVDFEAKTFTRLGLAAGLHGGDDFDTFHAFGGRRRCTVADNGTINHYYGDTGYTEDGSDGQVMVYQPKFYYKRQILKKTAQTGNGKGYNIRKANWFVSDTPANGFKVHPAFLDENGNEVDYILIGAYEGSLYDVSASAYILDDAQVMDNTADKFCSIANVKPASGLTQDLTRPKIEQMCQNRGSRWHEQNMQTYAVTELLYLIEYGDFDIQRDIGKGVADITDQSAYNCSANTGSTASFGNKSGRATSTTFNIGGTTTTETVDGKTSITYRGEENPCLNIWKFVMGMNIYGNGSMNGGEPYICTDYNYAESKNDGNYSSVGFRLPNNGNYVSAFGCAADESLFDWIFIPGECTGGSDALPVGDYHWNTANLNGYMIAIVGAGWNRSFMGGLFFWVTLPDGVDATAFLKACMAEKLMIVPGATFNCDVTEGSMSFRLNYSTPSDTQIVEGVARLGRVAREFLS